MLVVNRREELREPVSVICVANLKGKLCCELPTRSDRLESSYFDNC